MAFGPAFVNTLIERLDSVILGWGSDNVRDTLLATFHFAHSGLTQAGECCVLATPVARQRILLNGQLMGVNEGPSDVLTPLSVSSGLQVGANTLAVQVNNLPNNSLNPTGMVVTDLAVSAVPEPATVVLLASGFAATALARLRRRRRS